jgi:hypothetical protein
MKIETNYKTRMRHPPLDVIEEDEEYKVKKILDHKGKRWRK